MEDNLKQGLLRLLNVTLEMLSNPAYVPDRDSYSSKFRTSSECVEAAWRAAEQAKFLIEYSFTAPASVNPCIFPGPHSPS